MSLNNTYVGVIAAWQVSDEGIHFDVEDSIAQAMKAIVRGLGNSFKLDADFDRRLN